MGFKILGTASGIEQDSEVFTASASSASVLFTVDMTRWNSCLLQITSSGTSCTITYECSNDQVGWTACSGTVSNISTSAGVHLSSSTTATQYCFPKRAKYFRARVSVYGSGTVSVAYSVSGNIFFSAISASIWGQAAEGSNVGGNPVTIGVEARTTNKSTVNNGQAVRPIGTVDGRIIIRPHSIPEQDWYYAAAAGGILNTDTAVTLKAASVSGNRHYLTSLQVRAEALSNATELAIRDGAGGTVLWRTKISSSGMPDTQFHFENPLKSTVNTLLEVVTLTASGTGAVYFNAQGYSAP